MTPNVSMICVTNRPEFEESVRVQFEGQAWERKELIVVDSSEEGEILRDLADVHIRAEPGTWVGPLRNRGLEYAAG